MNDKVILKSQQRFKSEAHNVYTEEVNKIAKMMIKDCRLMIGLHRIIMAQKLEKNCKSEILSKVNTND